MKRNLLIVGVLLCCSVVLQGCHKTTTITIDPFKNFNIQERGYNTEGYLKFNSKHIPYDGKDEEIKQLLKKGYYQAKKNKGLKNGDTVEITYVLNTNMFDDIQFDIKRYTYKHKVSKLMQKTNEYITEKVEQKNEKGETTTEDVRYRVLEGVKIPIAWGLSLEEMQEYVEYVKSCENLVEQGNTSLTDEKPIEKTWEKGIGKNTNRKTTEFLIKDYSFSNLQCLESARDFGNTSSQEYRIEPLIEDEEQIGYKCVFRE